MVVSQAAWPQPRAAYLHVPFCRHRCGYCNFSVVAGRDDLITRFLTAIDRELAVLEKPTVQSVFIGGGTPTHLDLDQLDRLLSTVQERFQLEAGYEWSIEANPEDITVEKLQRLVDHGVNRISLGVQSFNSEKLRLLERSHSGSSAARTIAQVAAKIANVSMDLIFAAPGETLPQWQQDVQLALSLPIQHLSTYALTFEKGTSFWSRRWHGDLQPVDESVEVDMYQWVRQAAERAGMAQYEISNFARPGHRCRHNLAYWDGQGWFAAGPGAARFVGGRREVNHRSTTTYLKRIEAGQSPVAESDAISPVQAARERAAFGIRLIEGIDIAALAAETGVDLSAILAPVIRRCLDEKLVIQTDQRIRLSEQGVLFADTVASRFLG